MKRSSYRKKKRENTTWRSLQLQILQILQLLEVIHQFQKERPTITEEGEEVTITFPKNPDTLGIHLVSIPNKEKKTDIEICFPESTESKLSQNVFIIEKLLELEGDSPETTKEVIKKMVEFLKLKTI